MADQTLYSYEVARELGMPFWRVEVTNWGNRETGADATSLLYPVAPTRGGAALIVVGPDSTVDQAIVNYNTGTAAPTAPVPGVLDAVSMTLGLQRAGYQIPGPMQFRTAFSSMFGDTYVKDDGSAGAGLLGTNPVFEAPRLQLLVYERPALYAPPTRRNAMYRSAVVTATAGEQTLAIWPVMGRLAKSVTFRATGTLVANVRVGLITDYVATSGGVASARPIETTEFTGAIAAATGNQVGKRITAPAQFLVAYFTLTGGAGDVVCNLVASDDPCTDSST